MPGKRASKVGRLAGVLGKCVSRAGKAKREKKTK